MPDSTADHSAALDSFSAQGLYVAETRNEQFATPNRVTVRTLGGAQASLTLPEDMRLTARNGHVVYEGRGGRLGFQTSARGLGHRALVVVDYDVTLVGQVDLQGGLLAQYRLNRGNDAVSLFTIWQGAHSDLYTFDFTDLSGATSGFNLFDLEDSPEGLVLHPRDFFTALRSDTIMLIASDVAFELFSRAGRADLLPDWPGGKGRFGEFYITGVAPEDPAPAEALFFSADAVVVAHALHGEAPVLADRLVQRFHNALDAGWGRRAAAART